MEIGVDIVNVSRIKNAIEKNPKFVDDIFTIEEIQYCESRKNKYECYAARFAAKEAFSKARKTGINNNLKLIDIEVIKEQNGNVYIKYKDMKAKLSLSHEKDYAIAFVIIEQE